MSPILVVYTLLAFLSSSLLENATAQQDSWSFIKSLDAIKNAVENLQTKIELQADLLSSLVTKAEMQETSFVNLEAKVEELKTLLLNSTVKEEAQLASLGKLEQQSETQVTSLNKVQAGLENQATVLNNLATKAELQEAAFENLQAKVEELKTLLLNSTVKEEAQLASLGKLEQQSETQVTSLNKVQAGLENQATVLNNLATKAELQEAAFENLQAKVEELKTLLLNSTVKEEAQLASLGKLEQQSETQVTSLNKVQTGLENQTTVLNTLATKEEMQANKLTHLESKMAAVGDGVDMLTENLRATKRIVEGIIAGTRSGVVIIPLDSREQRIIWSNDTRGVAFNWQSRKVYWTEQEVGIKIADLDGSSPEILIADSSVLRGLAVDQITGNLYYMVQGSYPRMRVCDSRGKKCVNVASFNNTVPGYIWDIALFPSKGIMFWSSADSTSSGVFRANMDGTNASLFIAENLDGLFLDEITERLYWTNCHGRSIGNHNLNLTNREVLLNTTTYPYDVAVDGDTLYFGGSSPKGVYSVTSNGHVSSIANTTGSVYHIALFGRNQVSSRPNPCKYSACANLCVLTRHFYTCL